MIKVPTNLSREFTFSILAEDDYGNKVFSEIITIIVEPEPT